MATTVMATDESTTLTAEGAGAPPAVDKVRAERTPRPSRTTKDPVKGQPFAILGTAITPQNDTETCVLTELRGFLRAAREQGREVRLQPGLVPVEARYKPQAPGVRELTQRLQGVGRNARPATAEDFADDDARKGWYHTESGLYVNEDILLAVQTLEDYVRWEAAKKLAAGNNLGAINEYARQGGDPSQVTVRVQNRKYATVRERVVRASDDE